MKYLLKSLALLTVFFLPYVTISTATAEDGVVRSPQLSRDGLFWVAPHTKACAAKSLHLTNQLIPDLGLDNNLACNNPAHTYLHRKTTIDENGRRTYTEEVKPLNTSFEEVRDFDPNTGGPLKLKVTVKTTGPIMDTAKGTTSRFAIGDILPSFSGNAESARALSSTVSFGPSGLMRSQQPVIQAPEDRQVQGNQ